MLFRRHEWWRAKKKKANMGGGAVKGRVDNGKRAGSTVCLCSMFLCFAAQEEKNNLIPSYCSWGYSCAYVLVNPLFKDYPALVKWIWTLFRCSLCIRQPFHEKPQLILNLMAAARLKSWEKEMKVPAKVLKRNSWKSILQLTGLIGNSSVTRLGLKRASWRGVRVSVKLRWAEVC